MDKKGGFFWRLILYRDKFVSIMDDIGLIGVFRYFNLNERSFFYEFKLLKVSFRIDFYLVLKLIINWVVKVNIKVFNVSDYKVVIFGFRIFSEV